MGEMQDKIMYVCAECADNHPEGCGHYDRNDLRVMPDGRWLCDGCFDDTSQMDRGNSNDEKYVGWCDMKPPPEYVAKSVKAGDAT